VLRPHPAHPVGDAVVPVVAQIIEQEGADEHPPVQAEIEEAELPQPDERGVGDDAEDHAGTTLPVPIISDVSVSRVSKPALFLACELQPGQFASIAR
jgi:hypothetical protein